MKKIARRQSEEAQGGEKNRKNGKSSGKSRKNDDSAGRPTRAHSVLPPPLWITL